MNHELFSHSIRAAQAALTQNDRVLFIAAVRVAQSAAPRMPRLVRLLDTCINLYPSEMSSRILAAASRRLSREVMAQA